MCGIFGTVGHRSNSAHIVLEGLKTLEYRGYDSWGIAVPGETKILIDKHAGMISNAKTNLPNSSIALGHTRWATHGGVTDANAHPHADCHGTLALIHNGIVENYLELKKEVSHHTFRSETDSEVISHQIENLLPEFGVRESLRLVFNKTTGLNAFVAISQTEDKLVAAKNGSPIVVGVGQGENFIASDSSAILPYTKNLIFLEDGQLIELTKDSIKLFEAKSGKEITPNVVEVNWDVEESILGKNKHFMIKEILEQPRVIRNIAENYGDSVASMANLIKDAQGTFLIGCGTAANAALTGVYLFSRVAKHHLNFSVGSEFNYVKHFLNTKSLIIALSQSGETIDVIEPVTEAKKSGVALAAIVNNLGSSLYRLSDAKILLGAGPERSVCATKSFTAKLSVLIMLAYEMTGKRSEAEKLLLNTVREIEKIVSPSYQNNVKKLAKKIHLHNHIFVIGRGLNYPSALESALKIKEVSYIHAEGFAGGELKHGVIALIEKGTPCIVFAPNDETYEAIIGNAMELKARGAYIIGISPYPNDVFDSYLPVGDVGDASPIVNAVPAQLLAYYLSLSRGVDPDKPRNLAKSVTVK